MNIYEAIADIMKQGYSISKDKYNNQQKFAYRGIDDVMNTFQPLMADHGIFVVPEVLEQKREERTSKNNTNLIYSVLTMKYTFFASDGTSVSAVVVGEGMDSGDKASNKAMAVAMKYAMFQVFCIPTEEMKNADPDAESPEVRSKKGPTQSAAKNQPAPAPAPAQSSTYICADCNTEIRPVRLGSGKIFSVEDIVSGSMKAYGKTICYKCSKERMKARDAEQAAAAEEAAAKYQQDAMNMGDSISSADYYDEQQEYKAYR